MVTMLTDVHIPKIKGWSESRPDKSDEEELQ